MKLFTVLVCLGIAAALGTGVVLFPRALEPTGSDRNGIVLNLLVGGPSAGVTNDWYDGQPGETVKSVARGIVIEGGPSGPLQLVSRPLPVFPHRHYVLVVRGRALSNHVVVVQVASDDLHRYFGEARLPSAHVPRTVVVPITSDGERRLSILFAGAARVPFELVAVRLKLVR